MPTLAELNGYTPARFSAAFGPVYEHSPWIAERAYARRPFASRADLHLALYGVVRTASEAEQVALIRAHPELAGREAQAGALTDASTREQAQAGLSALTPEEFADLGRLNADYAAKFGFPFVICARLNRKDAIFGTLRARLANTRDQEIANAIAQIGEIARLRLEDLVR
ncbi:MAG: 2-oxo-4-hydroxy-4-carboxy-5-ureidoimidazoline decarboxylase [Burkholderiales bacterium]|nr:2-oxo-4-hydroxy-4-carboxy-5-ureidoimidazoline decarboxylase [Burkholderiales bacterium]